MKCKARKMGGKHPSYTSNLLSSHSKFYKQKSISPNDSIKSETPKQKLRTKIIQIPPSNDMSCTLLNDLTSKEPNCENQNLNC